MPEKADLCAALGIYDQRGRRMNCGETEELIHGFVDSELDLVRNLEMERHLHDCPACSITHERLRAMRRAVIDRAL